MSKRGNPSLDFLQWRPVSGFTFTTRIAACIPASATLRCGRENDDAEGGEPDTAGEAVAKRIYRQRRELDLQLI